MDLDLEQQRQQAHSLLDGLPKEKLLVVHNLLEVLAEIPEPLSQSLAQAPTEDDELTPETVTALNRAGASLDRGEGISQIYLTWRS